jgi:hypothetical protein
VSVELQNIFDAVAAEIYRSEAKHPNTENMPDGTRNGGMNLVCRAQAQLSCDRATRDKRVTFAQVLEEEFYEALCEEDKTALREELKQVAAVCCRWMLKLDREAGR